MKTTSKLTIATVACIAASAFQISASFAYGDAPWCAVISLGTGQVTWECYYRTVEECQPNVIAGNRGFCSLNPYGPGPSYAAAGAAHPRYKKLRTHSR
jgi:hypothetical protein